MAAWRRRALESFPELKNELNDPEYSTYQLFAALRHMVWQAHDAGDDARLRAIYGFAQWCSEQQSDVLWNAAGVSLYEHLFDERKDRADWAKVAEWLSPTIVRSVWGLWEWRLTPEEMRDLEKLFAGRGAPTPRRQRSRRRRTL